MGLTLALLAHGLVLGAWLHYLWLVPREAVPPKPNGHTTAMILGIALAVVGALMPSNLVLVLVGGVLALLTTAFGVLFLWLLTQAQLPPGQPTFRVGEPLPCLLLELGDAVQELLDLSALL